MRSSILIFTLLFLALATACDRDGKATDRPVVSDSTAATPPASTRLPSRSSDSLDVMEAVFRHQFDSNASGGQRNVDYFFLALNDSTDPPPNLLARFKDVTPAVLPFSMAVRSLEGVMHKDLGGRGLIFRITSITWIDKNTADVEGGYFEGGLSASGNTYRVARVDGVWKVTGDKMNWIS